MTTQAVIAMIITLSVANGKVTEAIKDREGIATLITQCPVTLVKSPTARRQHHPPNAKIAYVKMAARVDSRLRQTWLLVFRTAFRHSLPNHQRSNVVAFILCRQFLW